MYQIIKKSVLFAADFFTKNIGEISEKINYSHKNNGKNLLGIATSRFGLVLPEGGRIDLPEISE